MSDEDDRSPRRERAAAAVRVGVILVISSACLLALPAVIDLRPLGKYVVAFALIAMLIGMGCIVNGAVDLLRR